MKSMPSEFLKACDIVLGRRGYAAFAAALAVILAGVALLLPNMRLVGFVFASPIFGVGRKFGTVFELIGSSLRVLPKLEVATIFATAVLFGLNAAFAAYYVRRTVRYERSIGASAAGLILAVFGFGCAACGSVVLSAVFGTAASLGITGFLPFGGRELSLVGLVVLAAATLNVSRKIVSPDICEIPKRDRAS